jgi:ketosteroid isomerase-like protein
MFPQVINGKNDMTEIPTIAVLTDFYAGFNNRDVERCMENWADLDDVIMCNPIGGIRRGWDEIGKGYQRIMQGTTKVYVEFYDYQLFKGEDVFFVAGRERGYAQQDSEQGPQRLELDIRTSRIFKKINGRWRQVHHHGSMDNPVLLEQYQQFINRS